MLWISSQKNIGKLRYYQLSKKKYKNCECKQNPCTNCGYKEVKKGHMKVHKENSHYLNNSEFLGSEDDILIKTLAQFY